MSKKAVSIIILLLSLIAVDSGCMKQRKTQKDIDLSQAAISGNTPEIARLLAAGTNVHAKNNHGSTPLHMAAIVGNKQGAEILIKSGANVNSKDNRQRTALHCAVRLTNFATFNVTQDRIKLVELLLDHGTDINALDIVQDTPLHLAIGSGWSSGPEHEKIVQVLLANGANPNTKDRYERTPLVLARGNPEIIALLRKYGL